MQKENINEKNKGITLIALVITIIVMLILVGVTISVSLNGGLFTTAKEATDETQIAQESEQLLLAAMGALGEDGKVDLSKLDTSLPEGFQKTGEGTYKSSTGNVFTVNENGSITLSGVTEEDANQNPEEGEGGTVPATYKTIISGLATGVALIGYENLETEASTDIKTAVDAGKIQAVLRETTTVDEVSTTYTAVVPTGFEISTTDGEDSISGGLVIKDGDNEFVWVPVASASSYTEDSFGPLTADYIVSDTTIGIYDSYQTIQYLYGTELGTINSDASFNAIFTYATDKTNIENNIKTYGGFYVGRYETTYDSTDENGVPQGIGVKRGENVLQASSILQTGTNSGTGKSGENYYYRWWGLYKAQKDMYSTNPNVGSLMISNKQWDEMMTFTDYGKGQRSTDSYTSNPDLSGSAYSTDSTKYDKSKNIYDLAGNLYEWSMSAHNTNIRIGCGGSSDSDVFSWADTKTYYNSPNSRNSYIRFEGNTLY